MSAATADAAADAAPKKGKKKLIIILAAVLLLAGIGGGAAVFMMKKKAAEEAAAAEEGGDARKSPAKKAKKDDKGAPPVFVPLDMFTVNLADREAERYAQIGVTLEVDDAKTSDELKAYMPAIRNNILMLLAHKTAADIQTHEGKEKLAREIQRESLKPMGVEVEADEDDEAQDAKPRKKKKKRVVEDYPVRAVHFSNFIIQ